MEASASAFLTSKWPQILKPQTLSFTTTLNPRAKRMPLLLRHSSTTNEQSSTDESNSIANPPPNQRKQTQPGTPPTSSTQEFSSFSRGLIFDLGPENSWDGLEIGSPVVKRYLSDEEERWYMWYHGRSGANPGLDSIGLAVSSNGIHWERGSGSVKSNDDVGLVMGSSKDWWAFDTRGVRPCEVVIMSSNKVRANSAVYWLYYTGFCSEEIESLNNSDQFSSNNSPESPESAVLDRKEILKSLPGLAMSQDGRHWARIEGEHYSGAILDVGSDGEWDSSFISSPQVVFHGKGDLRMYYHSYDVENKRFSIGMARSRDGIRWLKLGKILGPGGDGAFDERGAVNARVVKNQRDGKYVMVYEGIGGDNRNSIGIAVSSDGLKDWRKLRDGPAFERSREGNRWDCEGVGMPCLVQIWDGDGREEWRLYYGGIGEGGVRTGIGLAVCEGSDVSEFQRWNGTYHL